MPRAKKKSSSVFGKKASQAQIVAAAASSNEDTLAIGPSMEEQIRLRAYELFQQRSGSGGSPEQDWLQAEAEIRARRSA